MLRRLVTALAGRSVARTVGGAAAGPAGTLVGVALPMLIPQVARALGPVGMVGLAVGGALFSRWMKRRAERKGAVATRGPDAAPRPEAVLGSGSAPQLLEGELVRAARRAG